LRPSTCPQALALRGAALSLLAACFLHGQGTSLLDNTAPFHPAGPSVKAPALPPKHRANPFALHPKGQPLEWDFAGAPLAGVGPQLARFLLANPVITLNPEGSAPGLSCLICSTPLATLGKAEGHLRSPQHLSARMAVQQKFDLPLAEPRPGPGPAMADPATDLGDMEDGLFREERRILALLADGPEPVLPAPEAPWDLVTLSPEPPHRITQVAVTPSLRAAYLQDLASPSLFQLRTLPLGEPSQPLGQLERKLAAGFFQLQVPIFTVQDEPSGRGSLALQGFYRRKDGRPAKGGLLVTGTGYQVLRPAASQAEAAFVFQGDPNGQATRWFRMEQAAPLEGNGLLDALWLLKKGHPASQAVLDAARTHIASELLRLPNRLNLDLALEKLTYEAVLFGDQPGVALWKHLAVQPSFRRARAQFLGQSPAEALAVQMEGGLPRPTQDGAGLDLEATQARHRELEKTDEAARLLIVRLEVELDHWLDEKADLEAVLMARPSHDPDIELDRRRMDVIEANLEATTTELEAVNAKVEATTARRLHELEAVKLREAHLVETLARDQERFEARLRQALDEGARATFNLWWLQVREAHYRARRNQAGLRPPAIRKDGER